MRRALPLACVLAVALAGCGSDEKRTSTNRPPAHDPPAGGPIDGRRLVDTLGCLACHQIGARGSSGPGSNLAGIGDRRPAGAIRRSLLDPPAPMPSYRQLPHDRLDALVTYLASLRDDCAAGSDCG